MRVFEENYGVHVFDVRVMNVVEDMMSSNVPTFNSRAACLRYIRVGKMIIKHRGVLLLFLKLDRDAQVAKTLGSTPTDNSYHYIFSEENLPLITQAADSCVMNDQTSA